MNAGRLIKVCGMRESDNIAEVSALHPDMMGFIFYPKSARYALHNSHVALSESIKDLPVDRVGVFVNESEQVVLQMAARFSLDYVQLHGGESPAYCRNLQSHGLKIIKAFAIQTQADLRQTSAYEHMCAYFLFDTKCETYGGSGQLFDWSVLGDYQGITPFLLSGGIGLDSLAALSRFTHPQWAGIDINSRFETAPAVKDVARIQLFIHSLQNMYTHE